MDEIKDLLRDFFKMEDLPQANTLDLNKLDLNRIRSVGDGLKALRQSWQLTALSNDDLQRTVAVGRPADPAHNDAYDRFLRARIDIASETLSPGVLPRLGEYVIATESVEEAVTPLALTLLEAAVATEARMRDKIAQVAQLLQLPDEHEVAPGLTVRRLRVALAAYAAEGAREEAREGAREGRRARLKERREALLEREESALSRDQAVARLKESAGKDKKAILGPGRDTKKEDK